MKPPDQLKHLITPLEALSDVLLSEKFPGVLIGGLAASLLGKPRFTRDVDAIVLNADAHLADLLETLKQKRIFPRIQDATDFARESRMLLLRHEDSMIDIDLSLGLLPFEEAAVKRRAIHKISGIALPLPRPEDLIVFKAVAHRSQDIEDIRNICELNPNLDRKEILKTVEEFSKVLQVPEMLVDLQNLLESK